MSCIVEDVRNLAVCWDTRRGVNAGRHGDLQNVGVRADVLEILTPEFVTDGGADTILDVGLLSRPASVNFSSSTLFAVVIYYKGGAQTVPGNKWKSNGSQWAAVRCGKPGLASTSATTLQR